MMASGVARSSIHPHDRFWQAVPKSAVCDKLTTKWEEFLMLMMVSTWKWDACDYSS
jgi:hypothetical protein